MRAWVVVAVVFASVVVLWNVYFTLNLLVGLLAGLLVPADPARPPSGVAVGHTPENAGGSVPLGGDRTVRAGSGSDGFPGLRVRRPQANVDGTLPARHSPAGSSSRLQSGLRRR
jgi:hypothetical protein